MPHCGRGIREPVVPLDGGDCRAPLDDGGILWHVAAACYLVDVVHETPVGNTAMKMCNDGH